MERSPSRSRSARCVALLLSTLASACGTSEEPARSAVLITLDTTRADVLSPYGGPQGLTPHLTSLARESVLYENAYTVAPITQTAHASMLTGLYPPRHTLRDNGIGTLPLAAETVAEMAGRAGCRTGAFVSAVVLDAGLGFEQGFEQYDAPARALVRTNTAYAERPGASTVERATEWLQTVALDEPFFLWVHLWDPHGPYQPPPTFAGRGATAYEDEVASLDDAIGSLVGALEKRGDLARALLLVVADHGEAFGEHGELSHGAYCYEPTLRVPFILRYPDGYRAGERADEVVSVADVHPTLLDALGIEPPPVDGESLYRRVPGPDRGIYFESYYGHLAYGWSPLAGWIDGAGKYLVSASPEYYANGDRAEERNLIESTDVAPYRAAIDEVFARRPLVVDEGDIDSELRRDIQAIGYAALATADFDLPHPLAKSDRVAPREAAAEQRLYQRANAHLSQGRIEEAMRDYRALLKENPHNLAALERLATCQARSGDSLGAIENLQRIVEVGVAHADTYFLLGAVLAKESRADEALAATAHALEVDSNHVLALKSMVDQLRQAGRQEEAQAYEARLERAQGP